LLKTFIAHKKYM